MDKLLFTDNPSLVEFQVEQEIADGYNLRGNPFILAGCFCQWMTRMETQNQYKLISAFLPSELETLVWQYEAEGFMRAFDVVIWNGKAFQWMSRYSGAQTVQVAEADSVVAVVPRDVLKPVSFSSSWAALLPERKIINRK